MSHFAVNLEFNFKFVFSLNYYVSFADTQQAPGGADGERPAFDCITSTVTRLLVCAAAECVVNALQ